jgi:hypothetical protein
MKNHLNPWIRTSTGYLALLITGVLLCAGNNGNAQFSDGTNTSREWIKELRKNQAGEEDISFSLPFEGYNARLSVYAWVIKDIKGEDGCTEEAIKSDIVRLNGYFQPVSISFILASVQYIDDYNYGIISENSDTAELIRKYHMEGAINLYLVNSIENQAGQCYGFTFYPDDTVHNSIFLNKDLLDGNYLVTLMGHFFGLLPTHDTVGGAELVSERNCQDSGDLLCDTYADPNLFMLVDETCTYGGREYDMEGNGYVPSVANLMSESYDGCKCIFTDGQYRRMIYCLKNYRYYLR